MDMNIVVTGSLSYDRIMDFNDRFREHIIPDKVHMLNVSFVLDKLEENFGGTAGNVAYNLKLLGLDCALIGSVGQDFERYASHLQRLGISTQHVRIHRDEYTSIANVITDLDDNQISAFYPGALAHGHEIELPKEFRRDTLLVIAPSSKQEMAKRCREAHQLKLPYLFDPGQQMGTLSAEELSYGAADAAIVIFNDYEWELFRGKTELELDDLTKRGVVVIKTIGAQGSVIFTRELPWDVEIGAAVPREVLDPTGAGDAYRAGIIAGFVNTWGWKQAGQLAATLASFAVEKYGTQEHKPMVSEINERYEQNFDEPSPFVGEKSEVADVEVFARDQE